MRLRLCVLFFSYSVDAVRFFGSFYHAESFDWAHLSVRFIEMKKKNKGRERERDRRITQSVGNTEKKNIIEYVFVLRVGGGPFRRKNKNAKPCEITFGFPCNIESQTGIL